MTKLPLSIHVEKIIKQSKEVALSLGRNGVDADIFFYCMMNQPSDSLSYIFEKININVPALYEIAFANIQNLKPNKDSSDHLTRSVKDILLYADLIAKDQFNLDYIPTEIIFLSFFGSKKIVKAIKDYFKIEEGFSLQESPLLMSVFEKTAIFIKDYEHLFAPEESEIEGDEEEGEQEDYLDMFKINPILGEFAENLNLKASQNKFDEIVDFDNKIDEITAILCRKKKPNAILVGDAGTGKTSIVQGLALKIVRGEAPELLSNKVIYSVNLSHMVAGTMYRGQFEARLKSFVEEAKKYSNLILFIDEIHTLVGAGGGGKENSLEAANILKPELARGAISCIGATTVGEYTNTIKKDSALDRRFEMVVIREPSKFKMKEILPAIIANYEDFHGVSYSQEFIDNIVDYCDRFIPNKFYPDKAITVIDHCGAQAKVNFWETDPLVKETEEKIMLSTEVQNEELFEELSKRLENWQERLAKQNPKVLLAHLNAFFAKLSNPLDDLTLNESLFKRLNKRIVGQRVALKKIQDSLINSYFGIHDKESFSKPDSFLIYGPNCIGKSLFCKEIKNELQKSGANIIEYNGIEFADHYSFFKILSDANTNTSLAERIILSPNSIIIIDDAHKINHSCFGLLSQILKEGKLQMKNGETADFSSAKFIITCDSKSSSSMGFNAKAEHSPSLNKDILKFIDSQICFSSLVEKDLRRIFYNRLSQLKQNLIIRGVNLNFNFKLIKGFVKTHCKENKNVEDFNKKIEELIISQASKKILNGETNITLN
jgi:ATP-dependent Clp protease ATP-binding subunit ClpC